VIPNTCVASRAGALAADRSFDRAPRRFPRVVQAMLAMLAALLIATQAYAQVPVPKLSARVTDLTNTLSAEQRQALETRLAEFEARKGAQIAILLVPTTQPEVIEQYARRVLDDWKLGRKGIDDGALLLIAMQDRKLRIETQYGLEGPLPDATAKRIVDEIIVPRFKQKDFFGGISAGIERMIAVVDGEPLPEPQPKSGSSSAKSSESEYEGLLMIGFVLVFVVGAILRSIFGRFGGAAATAGIGGVIAWFVIGSMLAVGIVAVLLFVISLIVGFAGVGNMARGRHGGWSGGSWGGGGGSWGGGGGGWSGGGGGGGGGGASGDW